MHISRDSDSFESEGNILPEPLRGSLFFCVYLAQKNCFKNCYPHSNSLKATRQRAETRQTSNADYRTVAVWYWYAACGRACERNCWSFPFARCIGSADQVASDAEEAAARSYPFDTVWAADDAERAGGFSNRRSSGTVRHTLSTVRFIGQ